MHCQRAPECDSIAQSMVLVLGTRFGTQNLGIPSLRRVVWLRGCVFARCCVFVCVVGWLVVCLVGRAVAGMCAVVCLCGCVFGRARSLLLKFAMVAHGHIAKKSCHFSVTES